MEDAREPDGEDPREAEGYAGRVSGPPWILGHRGAPREAPENTLSALRRALELGLDGVEYDLQACATGEPVLLHDDTLDRTTDATGAVSLRTLPELFGIDAGSWFDKRFAGESLPLLQEALEVTADPPGPRLGRRAMPQNMPQHMIELKDPSLVREVARELAELERPLSFRIASFHREVCLEARDRELPAMLLAHEATEADRVFVRDQRLAAYGTAAGGWRTRAGAGEWDCERWSWSVDDPADLLAACRRPLFGFNTDDPRRALAVRALVFACPRDEGPYPLQVPTLEVPQRDDGDGAHGEWSGRWTLSLSVRNPLPFPARVSLEVLVLGGAFEVTGLPVQARLTPGASRDLFLEISGGSWSPCEDPTVVARFRWSTAPGRPEEELVLDAPLERVRTCRLGSEVLRLPMLRESPGQPYASVRVQRRGREILLWVENAGGLAEARAMIRLGPRIVRGGHGARIPLPEAWRDDPRGIPFAVGFVGRDERAGGTRILRRWSGGLPAGLRAGAPGRLLLGETRL